MKRKEVLSHLETVLLPAIVERYDLEGCDARLVPGHEGGHNLLLTCECPNAIHRMIRISHLGDRSREDLLAETEFVRYLRDAGGSVADVIPSRNGHFVEEIPCGGEALYVSLFERARGKLMVENYYRYREGIPMKEYYFNCGKILGRIHQLSKEYHPRHRRQGILDKYTPRWIEDLIPASLPRLKERMLALLDALRGLDRDPASYGMIHFDYCDGNYCVDFENGDITVFDFDNACFGWYLYDLADLWRNGVGWTQFEPDVQKRQAFMDAYFGKALEGYRSETCLEEASLSLLPLFLKAAQMESILDLFELARLTQEVPELDEEWAYQVRCLEGDLPYLGLFEEIYSCDAPFTLEV